MAMLGLFIEIDSLSNQWTDAINKDESKTHQCIDMPLKHKMSAQNPPTYPL